MFLHGVDLLGEASGAEVLTWSRVRLILSRLAVVVGVLLLVVVLVVIRLFVHIDVKTDWAEGSISAISNATSNATHPPSVDFPTVYPNSTLLVLRNNDSYDTIPVISIATQTPSFDYPTFSPNSTPLVLPHNETIPVYADSEL